MKVSLNQLGYCRDQYNWSADPAPDGVDALVTRIGTQLGAVEEVIDLGARYQGAVIVKVVTCEKVADSDHLNRCMVDDGGVVQGVERDENGLVQVVAGAANTHAGMLAVWLPPGTTVPESYGQAEPFVLAARPMRGVMSYGMLASPRELALGDNHEGLLDLTDENAKPGDDFASAFGLDDHVIDIENKMFTHRPDCFGSMGVARELAGIQGQAFKSPDWYTLKPALPASQSSELNLQVENELPLQVPRFVTVAIKGVTVKPSPLWLQIALLSLGVRPISNVVDLTNYMMLLTGQPLHAYDYDKIATGTLGVRFAKPGEKLALLNDKTLELTDADMVITDGTKPVGLAGVMGGSETEVSSETTNIILECATFDMYAIRRTSMRHGLFTDAVTRFNKGQSPLQNLAVAAKTVNDLLEICGGTVASEWVDVNQNPDRAWVHPPVEVAVDYINARLGLALSASDMATLLMNVEFGVQVDEDAQTLTVTAPFWRTDVELREDIVEEVGRLYGFDKLPLELPVRTIAPVVKGTTLELKNHVRTALARAGANEVLTYSFVHGNLLQKAGQDSKYAFQVSNALSPDLQYYRTSLVPSLLDKVHANIKVGFGSFALFELGKTHFVGEMDAVEPEVPNEDNHVALVLAYGDKQQPAGAPYYHAKKYLAQVVDLSAEQLVPLAEFDLSQDEWGRQLTAAYEPGRTAVIIRDGQIWGVVGEFRAAVRRALKLPDYTAGFEVHLDTVAGPRTSYTPLSRFPSVMQDITLKLPAGTNYQTLLETVTSAIEAAKPDQATFTLEPRDIYQSADDAEHKNITLRLHITSYIATLKAAEVNELLDTAAASAQTNLTAERI